MSMPFGLPETTLRTLREVLKQYPAVEKAVIYGSRAKGTYKRGSDIDLALLGQALDYRMLADIAEAFEESFIPYTVDLCWLDRLEHAALREHIDRVGQVLYEKPAAVHNKTIPTQ